MSKLEKQGGAFDPYRWAQTPMLAAEIATAHIASVLGAGWRGTNKEIRLAAGIRRATDQGARCVRDALRGVDDPDLVEDVLQWAQASSLFALGVGNEPQPPLGLGTGDQGGLVLIEFDRDMDLPSATQTTEPTRTQSSAVAAISLICQASFEIAIRQRQGTIVIDEAHLFASHERAASAIERFCRLGRSLGLLLILATQRLDDIKKRDLDAFLSRVLLMRLRQRQEAEDGFRLCRLEPTEERIDWLRQAGPVRKTDENPGRPSLALHLDMFDQHGAVMLGPFPAWMETLFSTGADLGIRNQITEMLQKNGVVA
jgi:hypothetical protein